MNFAAVDLNLLRVFDAMMLELSTVRAGERVGLSQPDVSAAVGKLRRIAGDELFVRNGNLILPTPRALQLSGPWREALQKIEEALKLAATFDPAAANDTFTVLAPDHISSLLVPGLASRLVEHAPRASAKLVDYPVSGIFDVLAEGIADLAVDRFYEAPDWIRSERVFRSSVVCVARRSHSGLAPSGLKPGDAIPPHLFCESPHVMMSVDGGRRGTIDAILEQRGFSRRVAMTVSSFHAVALAAAESDMIGSLPIHFARQAVMMFDLEVFAPPFDLPDVDIHLYWHRRRDQDPASRWLRSQVREILAGEDGSASASPLSVGEPSDAGNVPTTHPVRYRENSSALR